ncbi:BCCT family transporter [Litoribrevibacter albus]|uniref:BCCT family transporter n=1 Tax=Litoribrevibacter albus TaxID=1473156 RepID=A0AA37W9Q4_9GAMM|nr:BCCT family transporter [Litoribrevibacter albus]GLQ32981.1 BCCT family transporter [Litoribrevibacter albus]
MSNQFETDHEIGENNIEVLGFDIHNPVFVVSALLVILFVAGTLFMPTEAKSLLESAKSFSINNFDWLFMSASNLFILFCFAIMLLPTGRIKIGGKNAETEFSVTSWFAMLFAAGMGIGLMFWSVAEPVAYYTDWWGTPLNVDAKTPEGAGMAMAATMFHWGFHPWAIYAIVGLSLAFFAFNKGMPLTIRSAFYPLFGERVWGRLGDVIDVLAVLATIFGLATSLGLGAQQASSGLHFLFDTPDTITTQIFIIVAVTSVAIISVVRGLEGGVKVLSNINMLLALTLLLFVLIVGPTLTILSYMGTTSLGYLENIIPLSNWIGRDDDKFFHGWTVFYWAWWISWSPFVGLFIARISKGRTVRQFISAVLLVPVAVTIVWMSVFGGSALEQTMNNVGQLAGGISSVSLAMFQMLENLPLATISSFIAIVLVLVFFITSSDSGSLVIDSITAGGKLDPPVPQRVFWASMEGAIAIALLYGGGKEALSALQAGAITTGLPFTVVLLLMCLSLYKGLSAELKHS